MSGRPPRRDGLGDGGPGGRRLLPALGAGLVSATCGIGLLATSGWLITRAWLRPPVLLLSVAIGAVQAFAIGRGIARFVQRLRVHTLSLERLGALRLRLYDTVEPLVPAGLPRHGRGRVLSGFLADADLVAEGFAKKTTAFVEAGSSIVVGSVLAAAVDPVAGAALLAAALALVAVSAGLSEVGRRAAARAAAARGELADAVLEAVTAAPELAVYGRSDLLAGELARVGRSARSASAREAAVTGVSRAAATMLAAGGLMAVVAAGLRAHDAGRLSGVMLAVVTFAALAVFDQCLGLPGALAGIQSGAAAERRLGELGAARPPVDEVPVDERLPRRPADVVVRGLEVLPAPAGDAPAALSAVSLELPPGRRLAVVGPSGSGKTTLIHTILHFLSPSRGSVAIGGAEVGGLTRRRLAELVGWLPEENHVFAASLGENLRLADPGATDEQCAEALGRVGLGPWYRALGGGLRTPLGAGGQPLSAGERQRLAMARLLLAGGDVLLLDEPTAHVDPWSARRLASELIEAASERSVLVTGHDPHLAQLVDRVVELDADWDVEPDHERPAS